MANSAALQGNPPVSGLREELRKLHHAHSFSLPFHDLGHPLGRTRDG
jgi:hypothetical protein